MHNDFDSRTQEIQKCLNFYDEQILMYRGPSIYGPPSLNSELQPFDIIRERRRMHETDDYANLKGKFAIEHSMNPHEKESIMNMLI